MVTCLLSFVRAAFAASVLVVFGFVSAGSAGAATLTVSGSTLYFSDSTGSKDSNLSVSSFIDGNGGEFYEFKSAASLGGTATSNLITLGTGLSSDCYRVGGSVSSATPKVPSSSVVRCSSEKYFARIVVDGGGGDDRLTIAKDVCPSSNASIDGGHGDDRITFASSCSRTSLDGVTIDDEAGNDVISLLGSDPVFLEVTGGKDTISTGGGSDELVLESLDEGSTVDSGRGDDLMDMKGVAGSFYGGSGDDTINCDSKRDFSKKATLGLCIGSFYGDRDDDEIVVDGAKLIDGGSGNDRIDATASRYGLIIDGGSGDDRVYGGSGSDTLSGETGDDSVVGNDGNDIISGGAGGDNLLGDDGSNVITGGKGDDQISTSGGNGDNTVDTGLGSDIVSTYGGNDTVNVTTDGDSVKLVGTGAGNDTVNVESIISSTTELAREDRWIDTGAGDDRVYAGGSDKPLLILAGAGDDYVQSGSGDDYLCGEAGNDSLYGNAGRDSLVGGSGDDLLDGGKGSDSLYGESGKDVLKSGVTNPLIRCETVVL